MEELERCKVTGKLCYTSELARKVVNKASKNHHRRTRGVRNNKNIPKRIYKCQYCGYFHLTHFKTVNKIK